MSESISRRRFLVAGASVLAVGAAALVGGTYARYKTSGYGYDSARVAAFGVTITPSGSLFSKTYLDATGGNYAVDSSSNGTVSVQATASSSSDVVAPGTSSPKDGLQFSFAGTPEVSVRLTGAVKDDPGTTFSTSDANPTEVYVLAGDYTDSNNHTYHLAQAYYPVKYTLTRTYCPYDSSAGTYGDKTSKVVVDAQRATEVKKYIEETLPTELGVIAPNTDLSERIGMLTLTWEWPYVDTAETGDEIISTLTVSDTADTLLGWLAANTSQTAIEKSKYNLSAAITIALAVTQVD
jgi:hypothetical protein